LRLGFDFNGGGLATSEFTIEPLMAKKPSSSPVGFMFAANWRKMLRKWIQRRCRHCPYLFHRFDAFYPKAVADWERSTRR